MHPDDKLLPHNKHDEETSRTPRQTVSSRATGVAEVVGSGELGVGVVLSLLGRGNGVPAKRGH